MDTSLLITGGVMAAAGTILFQLKSIPVKIFRKVKQQFIYTVKVYQYDELFDVLESWLSTKHEKQYKDVEATLGDINPNTPPSDKSDIKDSTISYKQEENTFVVKYNGKRIIISKAKEKLEKAATVKDIWFRKYMISGFRAKKEINELLNEALKYSRIVKDSTSVKIYANTQYGEWHSTGNIKVKPLDRTIIQSDKKEFIINDLDTFLASEEWYLNTNISYRRGYCFYGPPGTGKTTLALALANYVKKNICCMNLSCFDNQSRLSYCFANIPKNSVLLIEDIDKVFNGRENVDKDGKVTFSSLLNCLDGAFYKYGLITIITTNHIDKLDEALLRSGRMDVKLEIINPSGKEVSEYLSLFYGENIDISYDYDKSHQNFKMSDIQEICIRNKNSLKATKEELGCTFSDIRKDSLIYNIAVMKLNELTKMEIDSLSKGESMYNETTDTWKYSYPIPKTTVNEQY